MASFSIRCSSPMLIYGNNRGISFTVVTRRKTGSNPKDMHKAFSPNILAIITILMITFVVIHKFMSDIK